MFYRKTVFLQSFDNANCDYQAEVEIFEDLRLLRSFSRAFLDLEVIDRACNKTIVNISLNLKTR